MNTHLHVLEAYTSLYRIWQDALLAKRIKELIHLLNYILFIPGHITWCFFDEYWNRKSDIISYGHDIEASWLLMEAAHVLGDNALLSATKQLSIQIATAALTGMDKTGGLVYEYHPGRQSPTETNIGGYRQKALLASSMPGN
ncbi:AGE family epimerase/isomerase [Paraflavitalea speifideaquila]|uniref:AGE family epimerase/isomerase n=1 Tax=Paraflavitalea speifideaquila TaxID=3076558 RepID=UPI0028EE84D5|nr:AGE family epimerase/isomerase [Paraflavitalea speifideiaquila]